MVSAVLDFRLVPRGRAGLACDERGVALGPLSLVEPVPGKYGRRNYRVRSVREVAKALQLAYGAEAGGSAERRHQSLARIARLLADGEIARAQIEAVQLEFPDIVVNGMVKLARALSHGKFNPNWPSEARIPSHQEGHGEWAQDGSGGSENTRTSPSRAKPEDIAAKKRRFIVEHIADAQKVAGQLGVPVENILGISALESGWGESPSAEQYQNYFGIHYPAPFAIRGVPAKKSKTVKIAVFKDYADSLRSFVAAAGSIVQNMRDPAAFAAALQNSGKFGIDTETGAKIPTYVASTIRGLRLFIERRRR
jgi:hypothetical protein